MLGNVLEKLAPAMVVVHTKFPVPGGVLLDRRNAASMVDSSGRSMSGTLCSVARVCGTIGEDSLEPLAQQ